MAVYFPPRYNLYGNKQLWFFETGNRTVDDVGNGMLTALVVLGPLLLFKPF